MAFITIAGEQLIAAKQGASQVLVVQDFVLANIPGLGVEPADRIETLPVAGQIVDTKAVTHQGYVNSNQVVYSLALDSTIGDYDFNWVGLKSAEGTLIAAEHIPLTQKRKTTGPVAGNNLTRNFLLAFAGATATTAIAVPAETWQIDFTTRLLQIDDRERLSNLDEYGAAAFFDDGFKVTLASGTTYNIAAGLAYVGGIRCEKSALTALDVGSLPKSIWMDVSLQGDINGVAPVIAFTATAAALSDNTDGLGFKHYLFKIADIAAGGLITDLRPPIIVPQAEAEEGTAIIVRRWNALRVRQAARAALRLPLYTLPLPVINTSNNTMPITATAKAGTGGNVAIAAGVKFSLSRELAAGFGITEEYASVVFNSPDLDINSMYFLRCNIDANNAPVFYVQKGALGDATPVSLKGTENAASGGGFYSTPLDLCIAQVITGAANATPVVRPVINRKVNEWAQTLNGNGTFFVPFDPFTSLAELTLSSFENGTLNTTIAHGSSGWNWGAFFQLIQGLTVNDYDGVAHSYNCSAQIGLQYVAPPGITQTTSYSQFVSDMKLNFYHQASKILTQDYFRAHEQASERAIFALGIKLSILQPEYMVGLPMTYTNCLNSKVHWEIKR